VAQFFLTHNVLILMLAKQEYTHVCKYTSAVSGKLKKLLKSFEKLFN